MSDQFKDLIVSSFRGGRNGFDPPHALADGQAAELMNVDLYKGATLGRKRPGATADVMTFGTGGPFTGTISFLGRHVPGSDETAAELWAIDDAATPIVGRKAASTSYNAVTLKDNITGNAWDVQSASINGKFFLAYQSAQDRLHVFDSTQASLDYLVVASGGGGAGTGGGGGGGGGILSGTDIISAQAFSIVVGAGGGDSGFNSHIALHGGNGGTTTVDGQNTGGSGGGGGTVSGHGGACNTTQGNNGGDGGATTGGGGGGGGAVGSSGGAGGAGGAGRSSSITGSPVFYGGGGGGSNAISGAGPAGGSGGGASGGTNSVGAGTATPNTGGGGGGSPGAGNSNGASGVVIMSYVTGTITATGGNSITTVGSRTIHTFTSNGTFTVTATPGGNSRRTGIIAPGALGSVTNSGSGSYAAVLRYYRARWTTQQSGVTVLRSEPGPSTSFTPSGSGSSVSIGIPTLAGEGETHWELEASTDNATFFLIATTPVGTTTVGDSAATTSYGSGTVSDATGTYPLQKSYKFLAVDQNRLLGFGSYTLTDKQNVVEFSAVIGSLNVSDGERVPTGNTITLDENDSGVATGLRGPMNGAYYAFKYRQIWKLVATGDPITPYQAVPISKVVGAISQQSIVIAEDETGAVAMYWMSQKGPWRYGRNGLEYLATKGGNVLDQIALMNLAATHVVAHTIYHADIHQVWFYLAGSGQNDPTIKLVWDVVADAWCVHGGESAKARCAVMFSNTQGATMSRDLKPYIGYTGAANKVWKCDADGTTDDAGTAFQAYVTDKIRAPWGLGTNGTIGGTVLLATAQNGVTIQQTMAKDYGTESRVSTQVLTPAGSETHVLAKFEDADLQECGFFQGTWGDASAVSNAWQLDAVRMKAKAEENT